jgi:hypothetical protein
LVSKTADLNPTHTTAGAAEGAGTMTETRAKDVRRPLPPPDMTDDDWDEEFRRRAEAYFGEPCVMAGPTPERIRAIVAECGGQDPFA